MRIHSKEYDYYDAAMKNYGEAVKYLRKSKTVALEHETKNPEELDIISKHKSLILPFEAKTVHIDTHTIFFCGKVYICLKLGYHDSSCFYDLEKLKDHIGRNKLIMNDMRDLSFWDSRNIASIIKDTSKYYTESAVLNIHKKYNSPIIVVGLGFDKNCFCVGIHKDCLLNRLEFFKVFDVYTAFQEIEMFLGSGVLKGMGVNEDCDVQIADKYLIPQKGFDDCSFRRCKDTRARKQKKGKAAH